MLRQEKGQAVESIVIPKGGSRGNAGALVDGLNVKNSRAQGPCAIVRWRAILSVLVRKNEGRGRSLLVVHGELSPRPVLHVAFLLAVVAFMALLRPHSWAHCIPSFLWVAVRGAFEPAASVYAVLPTPARPAHPVGRMGSSYKLYTEH